MKSWYRGLVQTLAAEQKMANILYIDFGNEECVPLDRIKQLATKIQPYPPCVSKYSVNLDYLWIYQYIHVKIYIIFWIMHSQSAA